MRAFIFLTTLLVSTCSASLYGAISTQYQHLDPHHHTYAYGYSDPNSQKHETRSHDGVTHGSFSYVDAHGHKQSISYTADPHHGFNAVGTNLPKAPADPHPHGHVHYASAHAYEPHHHYAAVGSHHYHEQHVPVIHNGVPVETPEVQHAKAEHFAAHAAAAHAAAHDHGHGHDDGGHYGGHHLYKRSLYAGPWAFGGAHHHHAVALTHDGVPIDEPAVQAAKAEHLAAHAKALGHVAHAHGAPVETPEVQHAKAAHFAAHAAARAGGAHHGYAAPAVHAAHHAYHVPVIHNGVPVETPEVQHAKAAHFAAVAEASSRAGHAGGHHGDWDDGHYNGGDYHHGGDYQHGGDYHHGAAGHHHGPIHIPVIHNGVPVEPPAVQHARAAHLSALAAAGHGHGHGHAADYSHYHHEDDGQYHAHYDHHY